MRDLAKEIKNAEKIIKAGNCRTVWCDACPIGYALKATGNVGNHAGLGADTADGARRWLRGWLSLATGKPVKE